MHRHRARVNYALGNFHLRFIVGIHDHDGSPQRRTAVAHAHSHVAGNINGRGCIACLKRNSVRIKIDVFGRASRRLIDVAHHHRSGGGKMRLPALRSSCNTAGNRNAHDSRFSPLRKTRGCGIGSRNGSYRHVLSVGGEIIVNAIDDDACARGIIFAAYPHGYGDRRLNHPLSG